MRYVLGAIFVPLGLVLIYVLAGALGAVISDGGRADIAVDGSPREIILVAGAIHYDILLPVDDDTRGAFGFVQNGGVPLFNEQVRWLSVGWGSEAFYTSTGTYSDLSAATVFKAASGDAGVIRFEVTGALPPHPALQRVAVSDAQLDALMASILADLDPVPVALPIAGFSPTDAFYPAAGRFNILRTCNVWIGAKLADAGLAIGAWTPTPFALTLSLWWNGHLAR